MSKESKAADQQRRRAKRKAQLVDGSGCARCGFSDIRALEFHHRDPSTKSFSIGAKLHWSLAKLQAEAEKCDIICANCHAIEHSPGP